MIRSLKKVQENPVPFCIHILGKKNITAIDGDYNTKQRIKCLLCSYIGIDWSYYVQAGEKEKQQKKEKHVG